MPTRHRSTTPRGAPLSTLPPLVDRRRVATPINKLLLTYKGSSGVIVTVRNVKETFSLEQLESKNDTTFMERSLADMFTPPRHTGFVMAGRGDWWSLSAGVFGGNINSTVDKGGIAGPALRARSQIPRSSR